MKKIISLLIAIPLSILAIFFLEDAITNSAKADTETKQATVDGSKYSVNDPYSFVTNNPEYRLRPESPERDLSYYAIAQNLTKDTMPIFGSSELNHATTKNSHPKNLFKGTDVDLMLIGAAYNQCLYYSTLMGAIDGDLTNRKVVLILSYNWFRIPNIEDKQFAIRFSPSEYHMFMKNEKISQKNKQYVADRTESILQGIDDVDYNFAQELNQYYLSKDKNKEVGDKIESDEAQRKIKEYNTFKASLDDYKIKINDKEPEHVTKNFDWEKIKEVALNDQKKLATNNKYTIQDTTWNEQVLPLINSRGPREDEYYTVDSKEFKDLECFLSVCKECNVKTMVMLQAINGSFYDDFDYEHEGKPARDKVRNKIKTLVENNGAKFLEFTDYDYTPYFLKDRTHPSQVGWEKYNEEIYKFYKEN